MVKERESGQNEGLRSEEKSWSGGGGLIEEKSLFRVVGLILESKVQTQAEVVSVRWSKEWSYAVKICYLE